MTVGANSKKYIFQTNFVNVFKLAGYVISSIMSISVDVYATCRDQKMVNVAVGTNA
jgi:hypothetical protein